MAQKPEIITFYNLTKGAVDVVDEMSAAYSTARISNRWPMIIFFSMLNIAAINARVLLLSASKPEEKYRKRRLFLKDLALELLKEQIQEKSVQPLMTRKLQKETNTRGAEQNEEPPSKKIKSSTRKRCHICPVSKDRKSKITCKICEKNVCGEHGSIICNMCG